jgi:hypothetical protein
MTPAEAVFTCVVVLGFFAAVVNHRLVAKDRTSRLVYIFMLGCFLYTESYIALGRPIMWLYVSLNVWGLYWFWRTRNE